MKLKDILGVTSYLWYGGGPTHGSIASVDKFKFQRFFVDNFACTRNTLELKTEPTWQNFKYDTYLQTLKTAGVTTVWATAGVFDWIPMPINPSTGKEYSRRKSMSYDPAKDPTQPETWDEYAELCRQIVTYYNGKGLLDYLEIGNEWDFKWNVPHVITPEEYAVCLKRVLDVCLPVNSTVKIAMGGGISPKVETFERVIAKLKELYQAEGKTMPKEWCLNYHWYMRNGSSDQGNGTSGITPEDANAYDFGLSLDAIVEREGLDGWMCTETGWATDNSKQHTPDGMDRYDGQGWLMVRLSLIWGACKHCKGISFWHCRDLYDAEPYAYGGINNKNWTAKPARTICEDYLAKYGDKEIEGYKKVGDKHYAYLSGGTILGWENLTAPVEVTEVPTTTMLTIQNNRLQFNGQPFKIIEANSPESRLKYLDTTELDYLHSIGVNTIYFTAFGGDVTDIHPFINRSNPSLGFDEVKLAEWKQYAEYWVNKGGIKVLHILLSEKENHYELSEIMHKAMIDKLVATFGHLPVIWDREELDNGKADYINLYYGYLKEKHPQGIRGMHNNTGQNPWSGHYASDLVQFLSFQENIASFDSRIKSEVAKNPGFAGYASEMTGGFTPTDTTKVDTICSAGGEFSSGAGFYIASKDLGAPNFQQQYEAIYKRAVSNFSGVVTPPTPTNMIIGYSTKADRTDFQEIGTTLPVGSYYVEARGVTPAVVFTLKKDGVQVATRTENGAPYDLVGGAVYNFTAGSYELTVKDKVGQQVKTFTVGTVTPPPVVDSPVTGVMQADGSLKFTAQDGRTKIL